MTTKKKKTEYETLYEQAVSEKRLRADPISCLEDLQTALDMVLNGYELDRISPKGQLITVLEKHPAEVPRIIKAKLEILKMLAQDKADNTECQLIILGGVDMTPPGELKHYP